MLKMANGMGNLWRSIAVGAALCLTVGVAQAQTQIRFVPGLAHIPCEGGTIGIDVIADVGIGDLRAASLVIAFDKDVVRPVSVEAGSALTELPCQSVTFWNGATDADSVAIDLAGLGCSVTGTGAIAHIVFRNQGAGESPLTVRSARLRDAQNESLGYTADSGAIHVECAIGNERATWGATKSLYR